MKTIVFFLVWLLVSPAFGATYKTVMKDDAGRMGAAGGVTAYVTKSGVTIFDYNSSSYINGLRPEWYGAKCDGSTDDTTAIQAALDAAATAEVDVILSSGTYMFSNLVVDDVVGLIGESGNMWSTTLKRITGSTGTAITDNGSAAKITLKNFVLHLNSTVGDGINLGNNTTQFGTDGLIENILVRDGGNTSNYHINVNGNVSVLNKISVWDIVGSGGTLFKLGGSANFVSNIVLLGSNELPIFELDASESFISNVQLEGGSTVPPLYVSSYSNTIQGLHVSVGTGVSMQAVADFYGSSAISNNFKDITVNTSQSGSTIYNLVRELTSGVTIGPYVGTGSYNQNANPYTVRKISASTTLANFVEHGTIIANGMTSNRTLYLPQLSKSGSQEITIINDDQLYALSVDNSTSDAEGVVAGQGSITLTQGDFIKLKSGSTTWYATGGRYSFSKSNSTAQTTGAYDMTLRSATVYAKSMGSTRGVRIFASGTKAGAVGNKTLYLQVGSGVTLTFNAAANDTNDWGVDARIYNTSPTTQRIDWTGYNGGTVVHGYDTGAEDTSSNLVIKIVGNVANSGDTIYQTMWDVTPLSVF